MIFLFGMQRDKKTDNNLLSLNSLPKYQQQVCAKPKLTPRNSVWVSYEDIRGLNNCAIHSCLFECEFKVARTRIRHFNMRYMYPKWLLSHCHTATLTSTIFNEGCFKNMFWPFLSKNFKGHLKNTHKFCLKSNVDLSSKFGIIWWRVKE